MISLEVTICLFDDGTSSGNWLGRLRIKGPVDTMKKKINDIHVTNISY